jgi:sulfite reductase (NADPH) flavoprotein alpha-component
VTGQRAFSLIVAFGTDMGNAEDAAMTFAEAVCAIGIDVEAIELNQVELSELQSTTHFIVVTSTFGEGEFPDNALLFWEALSADTDRLEHLSFAILALGDSSYEFFCGAGKLLDERLEALGATRLAGRVDVDGFYEQPAALWTTDVVKILQAQQTNLVATVAVTPDDTAPPAPAEPSSRERNRYRALPCLPAGTAGHVGAGPVLVVLR